MGQSPQKHLAAVVAAHASWAVTDDRQARTAPARAAYMKRFEDMVDPNRVLSEDERAVRAEHARKAHLAKMSLKAAKSRKAKREAAAKATAKKAQPEDGAPVVPESAPTETPRIVAEPATEVEVKPSPAEVDLAQLRERVMALASEYETNATFASLGTGLQTVFLDAAHELRNLI